MNAKSTKHSSRPGLGGTFWAVMAVALALMGGLLFYFTRQTEQQMQATRLGGPFELVDHFGRKFTQEDLKGKYTLLYFGYTHCPDVCPMGLTVMAEALAQLGDKRKDFRVVMVTVDPERDTPRVLKEYMENFGPGFIGLTGTPEQIRAMASNWRAFYRKAPDKEGDYELDHSAIIFLLDKNGRYLKHFPYNTTPEKMLKGIREALEKAESGGAGGQS